MQAYTKAKTSAQMAASLKWGTDYLLKTMSVDSKSTALAAASATGSKFTHYFLVYQVRTPTHWPCATSRVADAA